MRFFCFSEFSQVPKQLPPHCQNQSKHLTECVATAQRHSRSDISITNGKYTVTSVYPKT